MTVTTSAPGQAPGRIYSTTETIATYPWVKGGAGISQRWLSRLVVVDPVAAGDVLEVDARARVTSEHDYNIGVGHHLHVFDVDNGLGSAGPWTKIGPSGGDNVDQDRHHMPLHCTAVWRVPDTWPEGHRAAVVYLGDAHSTAWQSGHKIGVDAGYGLLTVRRWHDESEETCNG